MAHTEVPFIPNDIRDALLNISGLIPLKSIQDKASSSVGFAIENDSDLAENALLARLNNLGCKRQRIAGYRNALVSSPSRTSRALGNDFDLVMRNLAETVSHCEKGIYACHHEYTLDGRVSLTKIWTYFTPHESTLDYLEHLISGLRRTVLRKETTSSSIINTLRSDCITGYILWKRLARRFLKTTEQVLLQQIESWIIHGEIGSDDIGDFFIHKTVTKSSFAIEYANCPAYIEADVAELILNTGLTLVRLRQQRVQQQEELSLHRQHRQLLLKVTSPIEPDTLRTAVRDISHALSHNLLKSIVSQQMLCNLVHFLNRTYLTIDGEFADELIRMAQSDIRSMRSGKLGQLKDSTLNHVLSKVIAKVTQDGDPSDDSESHLSALSMLLTDKELPQTSFSNFLFGTPSRMVYQLHWPLDLFLNEEDMSIYGRLFDYLIALRRARLMLHSLWTGRRQEVLHSTVERNTWLAAFRTLSFLQALSDYYYADNLVPFVTNLKDIIMKDHAQYNPIELATEHRSILICVSGKIMLDLHGFLETMRKLFTTIDLLISSMRTNQEIAARCQELIALVDTAKRQLAMESNMEVLLLKLQIGY